MKTLESKFHKMVIENTDGDLNSPVSAKFDQVKWKESFKKIQNPEKRDFDILGSAIWFGFQSGTLHGKFAPEFLQDLNSWEGIVLGIATLNREYSVIQSKVKINYNKFKEEKAVSADFIANMPVKGSFGQESDPDGFISTAVDTVSSWLGAALKKEEIGKKNLQNFDKLSALGMGYGSIATSLKDLWQSTLWEGAFLNKIKDGLMFSPFDKSFSTLQKAWLIRQEGLLFQHQMMAILDWTQIFSDAQRLEVSLKKTIIGLEEAYGKKRKFILGKPRIEKTKPSYYFLQYKALENSYLKPFINKQIFENNFSIFDLFQTWHVILDMATCLGSNLGRPIFKNFEQASCWALSVKRSELIDVLKKCLGFSVSKAEDIIEFLKFQKISPKGLWATPLVKSSSGDKFLIALPPLEVGNPIRCAEIWLEKGGFNKVENRKSKGLVFEGAVREKIKNSISNNPIFSNSSSNKNAIKKKKPSDEEIDLVIKLDDLILVCEVKCWLFPTDPVDQFNYYKKIDEAATQAKRKALWAAKNINRIEEALGIKKLEGLKILPIVVPNQGYGLSLKFGNCFIIDFHFLKLFLSDGSYASQAAFANMNKEGKAKFGATVLYSTEKEACKNFEKIMESPPVIKHLLNRVAWKTFPFPTHSGGEILIEIPILKDISPKLKDWAANLTTPISLLNQ